MSLSLCMSRVLLLFHTKWNEIQPDLLQYQKGYVECIDWTIECVIRQFIDIYYLLTEAKQFVLCMWIQNNSGVVDKIWCCLEKDETNNADIQKKRMLIRWIIIVLCVFVLWYVAFGFGVFCT